MSAEQNAVAEDDPAGADVHGVHAAWTNFHVVFANPDLRRVQLAYFGSTIGDYAYGTALLVWSYQSGGASLVGWYLAVRWLIVALFVPMGGALADRVSRRTFMVVNDAIRTVLVLLMTAMIALDLPVVAVLAVGVVIGVVGGTFRPAQAGLIPQLAANPRQLTAANASAEILESLAILIGPAVCALLLLRFPVETVLLLNVLTFTWSMALVLGVRRIERAAPEQAVEDPAGTSLLGNAFGGFDVLRRDRDLVAFTGLVGLVGVLAGGWTVLIVALADERLGAPEKLGYIDAMMGLGTIVGGVAVLSVAHKARTSRLLLLGVLGNGVLILALGFLPGVVAMFLIVTAAAVCDPFFNVGFATVPQRLVDEARMSSVFGALESVLVAMVAVAAVATPFVIEATSVNTAIAVLGAVVVVGALLLAPRLPSLDARMREPEQLSLVSSLALFAPLSVGTRETLARNLETTTVPAGTVIVAEGGVSDRFYLIGSGRVRVTQQGRELRDETAGDFFGEIGLLRDVPRTATVTALEDTVVHTLSREDFLGALADSEATRGLAEDVVARRLNA